MQARNAIIVTTKENLIVWVGVVTDYDAASRRVHNAAAVGMRVDAIPQISTKTYCMLKFEGQTGRYVSRCSRRFGGAEMRHG